MKKNIIILILIFYIIYLNNAIEYRNKFESVNPKDEVNLLVKEWGQPTKMYFQGEGDKEIVYKYETDWFGNYGYSFVFDSKDSLLVRKCIDD